jgi:hypothetical protein
MAYNAEYVVYDSDISGTAQTYAVFVPPELKAEMRG